MYTRGILRTGFHASSHLFLPGLRTVIAAGSALKLAHVYRNLVPHTKKRLFRELITRWLAQRRSFRLYQIRVQSDVLLA